MLKNQFFFQSLALLFLVPPTAGAGSLTERVQETYRKTETFQARFVQKTFVEILEREIEERGHLVFARPGRFAIHYEGPRERKYLSDGKTLWITHPRDKEVEVFEKAGDLVSKEALVFLGGLGEMTNEFRVTAGKDQLVLVPRRKKSPFSKIILKIDPRTFLVEGATLFSKGGNTSRYQFSSVQVNVQFSDKDFRP